MGLKFNQRLMLQLVLIIVIIVSLGLLIQNVRQSLKVQTKLATQQSTHAKLSGNAKLSKEIVALAKEPEPEPEPEPTRAQRLQVLLGCVSYNLRLERLQYGAYWLMRNLIVGRISRTLNCADSITYTTHGDYTFFDNLEYVVERWLGPISFAIYAPGYDMNATLDAIQYVRNCLTNSKLVRDYVSFHIYFPNGHMPNYVPKTEAEALSWQYDCNRTAPYQNATQPIMYKIKNKLTYPINVGRNIARRAANTHYILACDIELYPSRGFIEQFLQLVYRNHNTIATSAVTSSKRVFVLPVFELSKNARMPDNKIELFQLFLNKTAILFHHYVCAHCHDFPRRNAWINATNTAELSIFATGKRTGKFQYWEPFYVSDNREPIFDERVTWEGQSNKRIQGYAMCLLNYDYYLLHPAFLIHKPGIKHFKRNSSREVYIKAMNKLLTSKIMPEYQVLYGSNHKCYI